jgi:hypothetical protein
MKTNEVLLNRLLNETVVLFKLSVSGIAHSTVDKVRKQRLHITWMNNDQNYIQQDDPSVCLSLVVDIGVVGRNQ